MAQNPAKARGVTGASAPPVIMISASPLAISLNESPMEWVLVAQAVALAKLGPLDLYLIEIWPEASLMMVEIKK
jgi:hypothetical protein